MIKSADSSDSKKRMGRPRGSKSKLPEDLLQDLIETKLSLAEMSLYKLKDQLRSTTDPEDRKKLLQFLDEIVERIKDSNY